MNEIRPEKLGDKYIMLDLIGVGGMAKVYRGKLVGHKGFEKRIVLKIMLPHIAANKELVEQFTAEARLAALLQHENIAYIYDFGEIDSTYFIAMEYLFGKDLYSVLKAAHAASLPLTTEYALYITAKICEGMDYAHSLKDLHNRPLNIIHRDLSPHNIFITYNGKIKIIDFGIAKTELHDNLTKDGVVKGKLTYMSPEQIAGKKIDYRSDIFSIGILLYEMVSGKRMYKGDTATLIRKAINVEYDPLENVSPGLPPKLYTILHKALALDVDARYQSCMEMSVDINDCLNALSARPGSKGLREYIRELFRNEYEIELERATSALDTKLFEERYPESNKTLITRSPGEQDSGQNEVTRNSENNSGNQDQQRTARDKSSKTDSDALQEKSRAVSAGRRVNKHVITFAVSALLILFVTFVFFFKKDTRVDTADLQSEPVKEETSSKQGSLRGDASKKLLTSEKTKHLKDLIQNAEQAVANGQIAEARDLIATGLALVPEHEKLNALKTTVDRKSIILINQYASKAEFALQKDRLTTPADDNAWKYYNEILALDKENKEAKNGINKIGERYAELADKAHRALNIQQAKSFVEKGLQVAPENKRLLEIQEDLSRSGVEVFFKGISKNIGSLFSDKE